MFWQCQHHHYLFCIDIPYVLVTRLSLRFAQFWQSKTIYIFQFVFPNPTLITSNWMPSSPHLILTWYSRFSPFCPNVWQSMFDTITEQEIYVAFRWHLWFALILNYAFCLSSDHYATQFIYVARFVPHSRFFITFFFSLFEFSGISRENGNFNWNSHFISFCQIAHIISYPENSSSWPPAMGITIVIEFQRTLSTTCRIISVTKCRRFSFCKCFFKNLFILFVAKLNTLNFGCSSKSVT